MEVQNLQSKMHVFCTNYLLLAMHLTLIQQASALPRRVCKANEAITCVCARPYVSP